MIKKLKDLYYENRKEYFRIAKQIRIGTRTKYTLDGCLAYDTDEPNAPHPTGRPCGSKDSYQRERTAKTLIINVLEEDKK